MIQLMYYNDFNGQNFLEYFCQNAHATTAPSTGLFQKATDRSWKTVYVVLRSNALFMYRDKRAAQTANGAELEEPPLPLSDSSVVEVAEDYTKRKNVFRLRTEGGSEYLFQVNILNARGVFVALLQNACLEFFVVCLVF